MRVLDPKKNDRAYFVEAANGSGKTLTFAIPSLICVDPSLPYI